MPRLNRARNLARHGIVKRGADEEWREGDPTRGEKEGSQGSVRGGGQRVGKGRQWREGREWRERVALGVEGGEGEGRGGRGEDAWPWDRPSRAVRNAGRPAAQR